MDENDEQDLESLVEEYKTRYEEISSYKEINKYVNHIYYEESYDIEEEIIIPIQPIIEEKISTSLSLEIDCIETDLDMEIVD